MSSGTYDSLDVALELLVLYNGPDQRGRSSFVQLSRHSAVGQCRICHNSLGFRIKS